MTEPTYCARHGDTPTNLKCSRCGTPICPRCLVHSPVGVRCPDCGKGVRLPVYDVPVGHHLRAIAAALVIGLVCGVAFGIIVRPILFGILYIAAGGGLGYLVAEGVSLSTGRKRGRVLQAVAMGGVLVAQAAIVYTGIFPGTISLFDLLGGGLGLYVVYIRLR